MIASSRRLDVHLKASVTIRVHELQAVAQSPNVGSAAMELPEYGQQVFGART
jgi:hypothetical protein